MTTLLLLENRIVSLEHVVQAMFTAHYPGGEDHDERPGEKTDARPAELKLILSSVHTDVHEFDYSTFHVAAASTSDVVIVRGAQAELAWEWMQRGAIGFGGGDAR